MKASERILNQMKEVQKNYLIDIDNQINDKFNFLKNKILEMNDLSISNTFLLEIGLKNTVSLENVFVAEVNNHVINLLDNKLSSYGMIKLTENDLNSQPNVPITKCLYYIHTTVDSCGKLIVLIEIRFK